MKKYKKIPWLESARKLYRPSDRRLLVKLVPTFADRRCLVVSVTDSYGRILGFLDRHEEIFQNINLLQFNRICLRKIPVWQGYTLA
jgi:hypothetical protein